MSALVTDEALASLRERAEAAEAELAEAMAVLVRSGQVAEGMATWVNMLSTRALQERAKFDERVATHAEQCRLTQARVEREQKATPALAAMQRELESATARLRSKVEAGDSPGAVGETIAYNGLVARFRDQLARAGLRLSDVAEGADHLTGTDDSPTGTGLRVRGQYWPAVDPVDVAIIIARRTVRHLVGGRLVDRLPRVAERRGGPLDGLVEPPPASEPKRWSPPPIPRDTMVVGRPKPYLEEDRPLTPAPGWEQDLAAGTYPGAPERGGA